MARTPYVDRNGLKKGTWTPEEDMRLAAYISRYGCRNWRRLPEDAGLKRCGKSCRLRWLNYLRPDIKRGGFTKDEEATILALHEKLGNKWSIIATHMSGRTDNEIKNLWNTHLRKLQPPVELQKEATCSNIDPVDDHHSPQQISAGSNASSGTSCVAADQAMSISRSVAPTGNDEVLISDDFWSQPFLPYGEDIDQGTEAYGTSGDECQMEREMLWFYHALMNYSY